MANTEPTPDYRVSPAVLRVLVLLSLSVFLNYIDRSNLSLAAPMLRNELGLSASQLGVLLSAFFWTYACLQIPAGWLVDRFEVKWVFAAGFFAWSVATAVTGIIHGFAALLVARIALGIGESVAFPSYSKIVATLCVERQRGFANAIVAAGQALGPSFGMLFGGMLMGRFGWRPFFITLGLASLLWLVPWSAWMPRTKTAVQADNRGPGIFEIVRQRSWLGTAIGLFCGNYFLYFLITWLPYYLVRERHFSMNGMAEVGGTTMLAQAVSALVSGKLSDRWIGRGGTPTRVRKTFLVCGLTGVGTFLAAAALAHGALSEGFLILTGASFGLTSSNLWAITQTLAGPHAAGRWMGAQNFVGNLAGAIAPALAGVLVDFTGHFFWPFAITSAIAWTGALAWIFVVGPVEPIVWETEVPIVAGGIPVIPT